MSTIHVANSRSNERSVGIDVGKYVLDIAIAELDTHWQVSNDESSIQALVKKLKLTRLTAEAMSGRS